MKWKKIGRIFNIKGISNNINSHCMTVSALNIVDDIYRVFFNSRTIDGKSKPYYVEFDITNPFEIIKFHDKPIIELGEIGSFDENGVVLTSCIKKDDNLWFYYSGFPRTANQIFQAQTGLSISFDGGKTSKKPYQGPIFALSKHEPYWVAGPRVYRINDRFLMYYTSCIGWEYNNEELTHKYFIKIAESINGIDWKYIGKAIGFKNDYEYAIAIPSIIIENNKSYKMWYTYRAQKDVSTYRIGYADSDDAINWIRKDEEAGIDVSESGWDSEMICFPFVFDHKGKRYMLYNGNGYGRTGFGLAVLEED